MDVYLPKWIYNSHSLFCTCYKHYLGVVKGFFSCFVEWISFTQPSDTLILFTHLPHTQKNVPLTHIRIITLSSTHIQLTHLSTTHIPLLHLPQTQLSLTRIQRSIKCHSHTYHAHKYINVTQIYIIGFLCAAELLSESENTYFWMSWNRIPKQSNPKSTV